MSFLKGIGIFGLNFLSHFLTKMRSFCVNQKGNFLNFSKLNLLLPIAHLWEPLWPVKHHQAFFLRHPVQYNLVIINFFPKKLFPLSPVLWEFPLEVRPIGNCSEVAWLVQHVAHTRPAFLSVVTRRSILLWGHREAKAEQIDGHHHEQNTTGRLNAVVISHQTLKIKVLLSSPDQIHLTLSRTLFKDLTGSTWFR